MGLETIKRLVGDAITKENLSFVDSYIYKWFGIFIPIGGNCGYAITPSHTHPSYMFVVSYDDQSTIYVADKRFESYPQSMFCLSPNIPHHEMQNYIPPKYCALFIDEIRFQKALQLYTNEPFSFDTKTINIQNSHIDTYIKKFINESHNTHPSRSIILENTASLLTHEIIRTILGFGANNTQTIQNQKLNIVIQHINSNYEKELSLDDLATLSTLSKSHFLKLFSASLDMTPMAYLTHIRLQNAKKMLLSHKLTITDISRQCGFNSPSYFSKIFKNSYNETPKEFQQRNK
jgi:AraC family transcriptional regulator